MISLRDPTKAALLLCALCCLANSDGNPVKKRTVSEMQLMHDRRLKHHEAERLAWLKQQLQMVHNTNSGPARTPGNKAICPRRRRRNLSWIAASPSDSSRGKRDFSEWTGPMLMDTPERSPSEWLSRSLRGPPENLVVRPCRPFHGNSEVHVKHRKSFRSFPEC
ncbi:parathyroid hormone [Ornithorhynchus anatinus]|uniref:parathyroid hormone n=1 Tax=Ornithorhynchus anatinus TaxID=9258 RepID=UPI0010A8D375|nr:parathyroid hormone [Ornithorhynchus anatinus]